MPTYTSNPIPSHADGPLVENRTAEEVALSLSADQAKHIDEIWESLEPALNLDTWTPGEDLTKLYGKLEQEIETAIQEEGGITEQVRSKILPTLRQVTDVPNAGHYVAQLDTIQEIHSKLLFNGGVEAVDGTCVVHDTIPLTITQIGVCLVSYSGTSGSWAHRIFRRDVKQKLSNPVEEALRVLSRRQVQESQGMGDGTLSDLARRSLMAYAERAILKDKSTASWRMGHGSPLPYELLTGRWASNPEAMERSLNLLKWFILDHKKFVFVPSAPKKRHYLTIGNALRPLEFAILDSGSSTLRRYIDTGGYRGQVRKMMEDFCAEVGSEVVEGVYRVSRTSPPYLFYAQAEYAEMAAHVAMADSILQEHRGFPTLIDLADHVCKATFDPTSFKSTVQGAYASAGEPLSYLGERETRK